MILYKQTNVTTNNLINFTRLAIESGGSLFNKIEEKYDLGFDGQMS
jgi:hypothetical protein